VGMASAYIDHGDFGTQPLDDRNYSCPNSADGLHDWGGFDRSLCMCVDGGIMHTYCVECGNTFEDCA